MRIVLPLFSAVLAVLVGAIALPEARGQGAFNEFEVKSEPSALEKGDVWTMDFRFKSPRLIKVNLPGRGTRIVWYMWYQVVNRTGKAREIYPSFELVTLNTPGRYEDELLIAAEKAIRDIEDPTGYQEIKNSVTITKEPIPLSKPVEEAFPRAITGVALWDGSAADLKKVDAAGRDLSGATQFSIFVNGLTNAYVEVDSKDPSLPPITRYKTLQLNFRKKGDRLSTDSRDIEFLPPAVWIYRAAGPKMAVPEKAGNAKNGPKTK